ncbi:hypothetical protein BC629DRAFT_1141955 [Irpex lacteus]|nr:hypothetical protein BC629DRAFT_1141955 [Irpex lacteus]
MSNQVVALAEKPASIHGHDNDAINTTESDIALTPALLHRPGSFSSASHAEVPVHNRLAGQPAALHGSTQAGLQTGNNTTVTAPNPASPPSGEPPSSVIVPLDAWRELTSVLYKLHEILPGILPESTRNFGNCAIHTHLHHEYATTSSLTTPILSGLSIAPSADSLLGSESNPIDLCDTEVDEPSISPPALEPPSSSGSTSTCDTTHEPPHSVEVANTDVVAEAHGALSVRHGDVPLVQDAVKAGSTETQAAAEAPAYSEEEYQRRRAEVLSVKVRAWDEQAKQARKEEEMKKKREEVLAAKAAAWEEKRSHALLQKSLSEEQDEFNRRREVIQAAKISAWEEKAKQSKLISPQHDSKSPIHFPLPSETSSYECAPIFERASTPDLYHAGELELQYPPTPLTMAVDIPYTSNLPISSTPQPQMPTTAVPVPFRPDVKDILPKLYDDNLGASTHSLHTKQGPQDDARAPSSSLRATISSQVTESRKRTSTACAFNPSPAGLEDYDERRESIATPHLRTSDRAVSPSPPKRVTKNAHIADTTERDHLEWDRLQLRLDRSAAKRRQAMKNSWLDEKERKATERESERGRRNVERRSRLSPPAVVSSSSTTRSPSSLVSDSRKSNSPRKRRKSDDSLSPRPTRRSRYTSPDTSASSSVSTKTPSVSSRTDTVRVKTSSGKTCKSTTSKARQSASSPRTAKKSSVDLYSKDIHARTSSSKSYDYIFGKPEPSATASSSVARTSHASPRNDTLQARMSTGQSYMYIRKVEESTSLRARLDF